jgi:hypothetical protein
MRYRCQAKRQEAVQIVVYSTIRAGKFVMLMTSHGRCVMMATTMLGMACGSALVPVATEAYGADFEWKSLAVIALRVRQGPARHPELPGRLGSCLTERGGMQFGTFHSGPRSHYPSILDPKTGSSGQAPCQTRVFSIHGMAFAFDCSD